VGLFACNIIDTRDILKLKQDVARLQQEVRMLYGR
jgi:hypothetical protein